MIDLRVAVLGSKGRLGREIFAQLSAVPDVKVYGLFRPEFDVVSPEKALTYRSPDIVINCTAYNGLEACQENPGTAVAVNTTTLGTLAEWCAKRNAILVHFSTDYVAKGGGAEEPLSDLPVGVYGATKLAGEVLARHINPKTLIFRISSLYGPDLAGSLSPLRGFRENPAASFKVLNQMTIPISTRQAARNALKATFHAYKRNDSFGVYNLTNHGCITKKQFAEHAILFCYPTAKPDIIEASDLPIKRPDFSALNGKRFSETFGIHSEFVYDDLKESLIAWGLIAPPCSTASSPLK